MDLNSKPMLAEVLNKTSVFLNQAGHDGNLAQTYWLTLFDWDLNQLVKSLRQPVTAVQLSAYQQLIERILLGEPLQYIVGYADFAEYRFKVTPATLIPREDSYGLVMLAEPFLLVYPQARVLDIGTGTGVLAIVLATRHPHIQVCGIDISPEALAVASINGQMHGVQIDWVESDLFAALTKGEQFDLIVANPPYISKDEIADMDQSVLHHEPHLALFADHQGLLVYERIAQELDQWLTPKGLAIFEIGFRQGKAVSAIFQCALPQAIISVQQDLNGLDRFVVVDLGRKGDEDADRSFTI